ncbi:MAG: FtsX-like permease family protein, partial [Fulvivirga sp.]|uniref:ABC transporter permease n=1 Tax=Fulvivirga sp. TaxID=1931237 RepID=UPI0032EDB21E
WINYINLSTAITSLRAKEVGVRKTIGANKISLIAQYLSEAFFYNLFAIIASFGLIYLANPTLSSITDFHLDFTGLLNFRVVIFTLGVLFIGTLGSGLYPAFVLSNIKPQRVLKGKYSNTKNGLLLRKSLIVFQFTMALILMILTSGIYKQVDFMRQRELGLNIDQVLITNMPNIRTVETFWSNYDNLKNQLLAKSYVSEVTTSNEIPGSYLNQIELFKQKSQLREEAQIMKFVWVDYDFFELYDMELVEGRLFTEDNQSDVQEGVIFTEEAIKLLGYSNAKEAIDQPVDWIHNWGEIEPFKIIGVAKNYEQEANSQPQAVVFIMNRRQARWLETNQIAIKLNNTANMEKQINEIGQIHNAVYPNDSFDYFFQDDYYNQKYQSDLKFGKMFTFFSLLTLSITILGIFGLTAFLVISKRKEVSIRRVLGANFKHLLTSFSKVYMWQIAIATLIALPLAYLFLDIWMNKFIEKVDISSEVYTLPMAAVILTTLGILIYHLLQTMKQNPAVVIRDE